MNDEDCINILTVDLEDWYHICEVERLLPRRSWDDLPSSVVPDTEKLLALLQRAGSFATFFVLGYVVEKHPQLVQLIQAMGHEIAFHSWDHELVYRLQPEEFRRVLRRGVVKIGSLTGKRPTGFRAPQWSINDLAPWALGILVEEGFVYDSSRVPLKFVGNESYPAHPHQVMTSAGSIWEFPPLTVGTPFGRYPAGGGWGFRCLPFPLIKHTLTWLNRRRLPGVFFLHPKEMSPRQSIRGLPPGKRFALHARVWSTHSQLEKLLANYRFASVNDYLRRTAQFSPSSLGI